MCTTLSLHRKVHWIIKWKVSFEIKLACKAWVGTKSHCHFHYWHSDTTNTAFTMNCTQTPEVKILEVLEYCQVRNFTYMYLNNVPSPLIILPRVVFYMVMGKVFRHQFSLFPLWAILIGPVYNFLGCNSPFCVGSAIFPMLKFGGERNGRKIKSWSLDKNSDFQTSRGTVFWWQGIWRNTTGQQTRYTDLKFLIRVWHQLQTLYTVHSHELRLFDRLATLSQPEPKE